MNDDEWLRRVLAAPYEIQKRHTSYVVVGPTGAVMRYFRRRYEAEAFVCYKVGVEMKGIEARIQAAAARIRNEEAERHPLDRAPQWEGALPTELSGHAVYRALGRDGAVLYVGVTKSLFARMSQHRQKSGWWGDAECIELTVYDERKEALEAESNEIRRHRPPWNIIGLAG